MFSITDESSSNLILLSNYQPEHSFWPDATDATSAAHEEDSDEQPRCEGGVCQVLWKPSRKSDAA